MAKFVPSEQQVNIRRWTDDGKGNAFVQAVAGAGKSTTLRFISETLRGQSCYLVFNKKNADEAKEKMPKHVNVGTFHSIGFKAIGKVHPNLYKDMKKSVNAYKTRHILVEMMKDEVDESLHSFISKLVSHAKARALGVFGEISDNKNWYDIIDHFDMNGDLENPDDKNLGIAACIEFAKRILVISNDIVNVMIDYDDMIYVPLIKGYRMWQYDWVLVDEAQDCSPARRAFVRRILKPNGRAIFVGDVHQAIYGFAGADAASVKMIIQEFNCVMLPLTVTYRCPKAVVKMAQTVVEHIIAHPSSPEGNLHEIYADELVKQNLRPDDAIICRNTKPLVETAFKLIRKNIPCRVLGKDIGKGLLNLVNRWKIKSIDKLKDRLEEYCDRECAKLVAKKKEIDAENLRDRIETLYVLMEGCPDIDCVRNKIETMFSDDNTKNMVTLATIHRCKGLEWPRTYILGYDTYMPSKAAKQDWEHEQEKNMMYVAYTRAKETLVLVHGSEKPK